MLHKHTTQFKTDAPERGIVICKLSSAQGEEYQLALLVLSTFKPSLQPNFCALLDVGTVPDSIYHLWRAFVNPNHPDGSDFANQHRGIRYLKARGVIA
ncbi:hypothetical protein EDB83DRAFT_1315276 [Lactarius deliciosus]|nr:hypothetical protein EDB83DRAFT_1315276 [Lactarius deliciosus]